MRGTTVAIEHVTAGRFEGVIEEVCGGYATVRITRGAARLSLVRVARAGDRVRIAACAVRSMRALEPNVAGGRRGG